MKTVYELFDNPSYVLQNFTELRMFWDMIRSFIRQFVSEGGNF